MKKPAKTITGFIGLCAVYAASAVADDISVVVSTDDSGNGDWRNKYGTCYSVVPWAPPTVFPEITVGPDFQGDNEGQYKIPGTTPEGRTMHHSPKHRDCRDVRLPALY